MKDEIGEEILDLFAPSSLIINFLPSNTIFPWPLIPDVITLDEEIRQDIDFVTKNSS